MIVQMTTIVVLMDGGKRKCCMKYLNFKELSVIC